MNASSYLSIGLTAAMLGVSTKTLRRWDKNGKLKPAFRTLGNHRRYERINILGVIKGAITNASKRGLKQGLKKPTIKAAIYGRVSSSRQKKSGDLKRQLEAIKTFCFSKGYLVKKSYTDVGSGLNDKRKGLLRMLRDASVGKYDVLVVNYNDRLSRFGVHIIKEFLNSWCVRLEVINPVIVNDSVHAELVTDLTAILYSFMGKLYRMRRKT